ncbi:MFS transporter [Xanthobacter agilis]|uniref:AAHS family 3-hydroxyphenylpropionic acid transporter n=1 Tax=Xanthobacter agilis TaxID=47492 RepID=A0ABU0LJS9_XANAG|nr:MFS transporter [Xanthobacter agilis]MDQ0507395.1 AAHS family 3-hydroxyphenylpropionic acid transporter [Xanthobacter agilis]
MTIALQPSAAGNRALLFVFLAATIEGFDLQAAGVAAPKIAPVFHLTPQQMGLFFSSATLGLMFGALAGGYTADRWGRRTGLVIALLAFGVASLATVFATSVDMLIGLRFLTGVGLGGALPNLVSIASEAVAPERKGRAVALMYAGMPLGAAVASLVALLDFHGNDWRSIFLVGGLLPLLLVPPIIAGLPALKIAPHGHERAVSWTEIFRREAIGTTALLWTAFFLGLMVVYLLMNWLPQLLVVHGFSRGEASLAQILYSLGGVAGSLIGGHLLDSRWRLPAIGASFVFVAAALAMLGLLPPVLALTLFVVALVGGGVLCVQSILYGVAPQCYPTRIRGTGVGLVVAVGRLGSMAGPLLAGMLVAYGSTPSDVMLIMVPVILVCGIGTLALIARGFRPALV